MRGDVIIVEEYHRNAARMIVNTLQGRIDSLDRPYTLTVAGESGSGKSEMGQALKEAFQSAGYPSEVLQQDDYFVLPPKSNDRKRREDLSWVGLGEVRIDELNDHLRVVKKNARSLTKPLVIYEEDRITDEEISLEGIRVVIAEGTYTTLLDEADTHVFIARDYNDTLPARKRRAREQFDPFIEEVLKLEHNMITSHRDKADIIISRDYDVEL